MLGQEQWEDLETWLIKVKDKYPVKFLISSCSMLYHSRLDFPRDRWSGFVKERERLLEFIAKNEIEGLYILSGDVHIGHAIHAEVKSPSGRLFSLWEFCSSPFEQEALQIMRKTRKEISSKYLVRQDLKFDIDAHNFGVVRVSLEDPKKPEVTFSLYYEDMHIGINSKV
jgi:phosphodiesterase/alkaline phosphatase D-like protein